MKAGCSLRAETPLISRCRRISLYAPSRREPVPQAKSAMRRLVTEGSRLLLARPELEVNLVDQDRQPPLFHAASAGNLETVGLLLADPRTNIAIRNRPSRLTAFDMATALGFTAIAERIGQHKGETDKLSPRDAYAERDVAEPPWSHSSARPESGS